MPVRGLHGDRQQCEIRGEVILRNIKGVDAECGTVQCISLGGSAGAASKARLETQRRS